MIVALSLMIASTLQVGVMGDARVAQAAMRELNAQGFVAQICAGKGLACIDDDACRPALMETCTVDAILGVDVRNESDGRWQRTLIVDGEGAVALSLDQPAEESVAVPDIAIETLRALAPRRRLPTAPVAPAARRERTVSADDEEELTKTEHTSSPVFWAGVVASSVGVVAAGAAATFAGFAEAERAEPTTPAAARVDAGGRARVLWLGAAAAAVVAVVGGATAVANTEPEQVNH